MDSRPHPDEVSAGGPDPDLLALLGHELRTPLTAILLWASSVQKRGATAEELERAIDTIVQSANLQSRVLDDLLDLSRLSSGRLSLQCEPLHVARLAHATRDLVEPLARPRQVKIEIEDDAEVGAVQADARRLQQAIFGLLSHAIKSTAAGGCVTLRLARANGDVLIDVHGEPAARLPERSAASTAHIDRRAAADGSRDGLALTLTRRLIDLHGGRVERQSVPGRGLGFRIRLPAASAEIGRPASSPPSTAPRRLHGVRVLVIEDDPSTRQAMQWILEGAHAKVLTAADGAEALKALAIDGEPPQTERAAAQPVRASALPNLDVVVCDLDLPDIDGCELARRIVRAYARAERSAPALCALTAHTRLADRQRALDAGFDLHLAKPLTAQRLTEAIDDLCDVARRANRKCPPLNQECAP